MQRKLLLIAIAMACSLPGCSKKSPSALPPPPGGSSGQSDAGEVPGSAPGSQADFALRMNGQDTIYFDTDRFNIDATDAIALQAQAAWLQQYPQKYAVIEGHADERGTREYNLALGERRATAAKNYLESLGVGQGRISVVSYGKERPAALGSDESAWARNRRSVTITID